MIHKNWRLLDLLQVQFQELRNHSVYHVDNKDSFYIHGDPSCNRNKKL